MDKNRILGIYTDFANRKTFGGCGYYRCVCPMENLGVKTVSKIFGEVYGQNMRADLAWQDLWSKYDIIYCMKIDNPHALTQMLATRDHCSTSFLRKKIIFDLDDDYFTIDPLSPASKIITPEKLQVVKVMLQEADALTVTCEHLRQQYLQYNKNIYILPNYLNLKDFNVTNKKKNDGKIRIGWQGSWTHERDLMMVMKPLRKLLKLNPNVIFVHVGHDSDIFDTLPEGQHEFVKGVNEFYQVAPHIASQGFDIGIAPLADMKFNYSKSAIKYYEYSTLKIPSVCTGYNWSPYYGKYKHNETGLYATDHDSWYENMRMLVKNEVMRIEMGLKAYNHIVKNYTIQGHTNEWIKMFDTVKG